MESQLVRYSPREFKEEKMKPFYLQKPQLYIDEGIMYLLLVQLLLITTRKISQVPKSDYKNYQG
jgi:hypothetical protein